MPQKQNTSSKNPPDTAPIERAFEETCFSNLQITHRLELRRLVTSLWYDAEMKKQGGANQNDISPLRALTNFKANLQRRKKTSDTLTSSRLMEVPKPARAILLTDIAYTFRDKIDDYTQIDFGNPKHMKLLKAAVDSSTSKIAGKQGHPVNEPLDEFFIGLRDLYEAATGQTAIATAHYNREPSPKSKNLLRPSKPGF